MVKQKHKGPALVHIFQNQPGGIRVIDTEQIEKLSSTGQLVIPLCAKILFVMGPDTLFHLAPGHAQLLRHPEGNLPVFLRGSICPAEEQPAPILLTVRLHQLCGPFIRRINAPILWDGGRK